MRTKPLLPGRLAQPKSSLRYDGTKPVRDELDRRLARQDRTTWLMSAFSTTAMGVWFMFGIMTPPSQYMYMWSVIVIAVGVYFLLAYLAHRRTK